MIWKIKRKAKPKVGDVRWIKRFAWIPARIKIDPLREDRWTEDSHWVWFQHYWMRERYCHDGWGDSMDYYLTPPNPIW